MNESIPAADFSQPDFQPAYKDRSTGLTIFGVITIVLGCLAGLCTLMMIGAATMNAKNPNMPPNATASFLPGIAIYVTLAAALIWLGIGSIMARRWARALLLIFSWSWLVMGILMTILMPIVASQIFSQAANPTNGQHSMPPGAAAGIIIFMVLFFGAFFVVMPGIWVFFYRSRHVKATCEARDPIMRWTDACPLPVLGFCLWLMLSVIMLLIMPFIGRGVVPLFGIFLNGAPAAFFDLAMAGLWAYSAYLLYHLKPLGWWIILIALVTYTVSGLVTFAQHDMAEFYQRMGYPPDQIAQIQKIGFIGHMNWFMLGCMVPFLGYLLFIKQYLGEKNASKVT